MSETSVAFADARVDAHGRIVYDPRHPKSAKPFLEAFKEEEFGKEFEPYWTREAAARVMQVVEEKFPNQQITLAMLGSITHLLIISRDPEVVPPEPEQEDTPVDDRPRDARGKFLSEFAIYCSTHSMKDIRARASIDRLFGDEFRKQYSQVGLQQGPFKVLNPALAVASPETQEVATFAKHVQAMSSGERRPVAGYITVAGKRYTVTEFHHMTDLAINANLL